MNIQFLLLTILLGISTISLKVYIKSNSFADFITNLFEARLSNCIIFGTLFVILAFIAITFWKHLNEINPEELPDLRSHFLILIFELCIFQKSNWIHQIQFIGSILLNVIALILRKYLEILFSKSNPTSPRPFTISILLQSFYIIFVLYLSFSSFGLISTHPIFNLDHRVFTVIIRDFTSILFNLFQHINLLLSITSNKVTVSSGINEVQSKYHLKICSHVCNIFLYIFTLIFLGFDHIALFEIIHDFGSIKKNTDKYNQWIEFARQIKNLPEGDQHPEDLCIVCRDSLVGKCKKLPCGHCFHEECILKWSFQRMLCPLCNNEIDVTGKTIDMPTHGSISNSAFLKQTHEMMKVYQKSSLAYVDIFSNK